MPTNRIEHYGAPSPDGYGSYPGSSGEGGSGFGPAQVVRVLRTRWWMILLGVATAFGAAWYLIPADQTSYNATAVLRLEDTRAAVSGGLAPGTTDTRSTEYMLSQVHVLRSDALAGEVVDELGLRFAATQEIPYQLFTGISVAIDPTVRDSLHFTFAQGGFTVRASNGQQISGSYGTPVTVGGVTFTLSGRPGAETSEGVVVVHTRQETIASLTSRLFGAPRERTAILDITYRDTDPARAQNVVNTVALAYQRFNSVGVLDQVRVRREFIEEQLLEASGNFERAQQRLRDYQAADRTFGSQERLTAERGLLAELDRQARLLEDERLVYTSFLDRIENLSGAQIDGELRILMASPGAAASPLLTQLYTQLNTYQTERELLLAGGLAPTNLEIQRLDTLIEQARASIASAAQTQISSVDLRIAALDGQRAQSMAMLRALPETGTEEIRLVDEVESARSLVTTLRAQHQSVRLSESMDVSQVQIIDMARYVTPVTVGNRQRALIIALVFGFLFGGGSAVLIEVMNPSVRGRGELEDLLALPALGIIPRIGPANGKPKNTFDRKPQALGAGSANGGRRGRIFMGQSSSGTPIGVTADQPDLNDFQSTAAEAYRILRTNLVFLTPDRDMRTLLVTSASSGEGKTTTAANLAIAFARQGKRVLLVDCDLRRPRLHTIFGVERSPGFSDLLVDGTNLSAAIRPTPVERLYLLPRGDFDERAAELLSGSAGRNLMAKLQNHWDLVIFDTSPVLLTADAAAVAPMTDGVILVVCAGRTSRDAARQAVQQLQVVGAPVLGFVLNDPQSLGERYGEYRYNKEYYAVEA